MYLSSISSVVQTIGGLLTREVTSLMGVKDQVEDLQRELKWMQSFLKEADVRKADNEVVRTAVAEIRELAYDAEDVIETFALKVAPRRRGCISKAIKRSTCILNKGWLLYQTRGEIEKATAKITTLTRRLQAFDVRILGDGAGSSSSNHRREMRRHCPQIIDDNVVGLDDDIEKLVSVLVDGESDCKVVSICGMGGLGKTTLAKKIYRHTQVTGHFDRLAWVYVSQQFQIRRVWEDILSGLTSINERGSKQSDEEFAAKLHKFLKDNKCLVILDDIWSIEAWDRLKLAFPDAMETNSKFLLTSRNKEVALHADRRGYPYELHYLNDEESWELFRMIAFPQADSTETIVDTRKEELGKEMVRHCAGLPLAIIVLGGILTTRNSVHDWKMAFENAKSYLKRGQGLCTEDVLALSYNDLPPYLRPCFLYLCVFPENYEIRVERLIQLWVAEGIVSSEDEGNGGEVLMEDVAERCLVELVERCMVQVGERGPALKIKTCRMHDLMRDLCVTTAKKENLLCIVDDPSFSPSISRGVRRIVTHQTITFRCIKKSPLRSMLFFANPFDRDALRKDFLNPKIIKYVDKHKDYECSSLLLVVACFLLWKVRGSWAYLFNNFKLLRVLEFEEPSKGYKCKLPNAIGNLIHLRFLNLRGFVFFCSRIPFSLGNLRCLQTLDLRIRGGVCRYVPNVIWKLEQLRHLYLPAIMNTKTKLKLHTLRNLLTLINFNTKNCFTEDLSKLINLRKFKGHELEEDPMPTLEKLPNLRILKVKDVDSTGKKMVCSAPHFPKLESLTLYWVRNLEEWKVEQGAMPTLRHLEISTCENLKVLPDGMRFITTFHELMIKDMPRQFEDKIREGGEDFYKVQHVPSIIFSNTELRQHIDKQMEILSLNKLKQ